jgi:hypothetical protein
VKAGGIAAGVTLLAGLNAVALLVGCPRSVDSEQGSSDAGDESSDSAHTRDSTQISDSADAEASPSGQACEIPDLDGATVECPRDGGCFIGCFICPPTGDGACTLGYTKCFCYGVGSPPYACSGLPCSVDK